MGYKDVNVVVGGYNHDGTHPQTYKTVILKAGIPLGDQFTEENTIYVVKWDFEIGMNKIYSDLDLTTGGTMTIDGTTYYWSLLISGADNNTLNLCDNTVFFCELHSDVLIPERSMTLDKDEAIRIVSPLNTYHEKAYYTEANAVVIPENCVLKFEGGSFNNGGLVGNSTTIESDSPCISNVKLHLMVNNGETHYNWLKSAQYMQDLVDCSSAYDGVVDLDEATVTLTEPINIDRQVDTKLRYLTIKNGTIILDCDYGFYSTLSTGQEHPKSEYIRFDNILFERNNDTSIVFRDGDFLRVKVENCEFVGVPLINSTTSYLQSYYIHNCLFRNYSDSLINVGKVWDVQFTNNSVERSPSSIFINITDLANVLNATNNLAEDLTEFIHVDKTTGLSVCFNYFETVRKSIVTIEHADADYVSRGFSFIGNRCQINTAYAELDDDGNYYYITIGFVKNYIICGNTFMKTGSEDSSIKIINIINVRSYGLFTDYFDTQGNLYDNYKGNINIANSLVTLKGDETYDSVLRSGYLFPNVDDAAFKSNIENTQNSIYTIRTIGRSILNVMANPLTKEKVIEQTLMSSFAVKNLPIRYIQIVNSTGLYKSKKVRVATLIDEAYGDDWNSDDLNLQTPDIAPGYTNGILRLMPNKGLQIWYYDGWVNAFDGMPVIYARKGTTLDRPQLEHSIHHVGFQYFDTTLGKPIWWNGTAWVDATGTEV